MENPQGYQQIEKSRYQNSGWAQVAQSAEAAQQIPASLAETGKLVTTISKIGGVGLGRYLNGEVYYSMGNGFYNLSKNGMGGLKRFIQDGGEGYMKAVRGLFGGLGLTAQEVK